MPEVCDGIDNDCDLAIDEELDVVANQPKIFGIACDAPVPPNDQPPCAAGIVRCINGEPLCLGARGPGEEICNGLDDDCDGVGDNDAACPGATQCVEAQCVFERVGKSNSSSSVRTMAACRRSGPVDVARRATA